MSLVVANCLPLNQKQLPAMGVIYTLHKMNRTVDACDLIRQKAHQISSGIFSGNPGKLADLVVRGYEKRNQHLFSSLKQQDLLLNAHIWASCGVATIVENSVQPGEILQEKEFVAGYDFFLLLLSRLLDDIRFNHTLTLTLSPIEADLLDKCREIQTRAFQELE